MTTFTTTLIRFTPTHTPQFTARLCSHAALSTNLTSNDLAFLRYLNELPPLATVQYELRQPDYDGEHAPVLTLKWQSPTSFMLRRNASFLSLSVAVLNTFLDAVSELRLADQAPLATQPRPSTSLSIAPVECGAV